ncbi:kinetochore-associated protein DSN1 homolog, partial [Pyrgilauda ruficollis]|uniref:kinetochore-associated protein DSN1 homolog n=1 Tax=Pyrgilauda ruficollis TaxID=221976 RepID=UPI001B85D073
MAAKPEPVSRMRKTLRASERRETAMAEAAVGPGGSPGPAAAPSPRGSAGQQEDERCPGGPSSESGGAAPDPDSAAGAAHAGAPLTPLAKKGTPSSSGRKRRAAGSPWKEPPLESFRLSPLVASPQDQRRSWRRSSLKGRRSRRKSLPPVHQELRDLSKSISLDLPEVQRLSLLLLSSFQFSARKLQQVLEQSEGFDPEAFAAKVQKGSEEFQRLLQRLLHDGTLRKCLEPSPG